MSDRTPTKALALVSAVVLVIAAISGGAVTYATFTDDGNVAVTFSVGNVPEDPEPDASRDATPTETTDPPGNGTEGEGEPDSRGDGGTDTNDSATTDTNDSATTDTNDSATTDTNDSSVSNESSVDRVSARIRSESAGQPSSDEGASSSVWRAPRDSLPGERR